MSARRSPRMVAVSFNTAHSSDRFTRHYPSEIG